MLVWIGSCACVFLDLVWFGSLDLVLGLVVTLVCWWVLVRGVECFLYFGLVVVVRGLIVDIAGLLVRGLVGCVLGVASVVWFWGGFVVFWWC